MAVASILVDSNAHMQYRQTAYDGTTVLSIGDSVDSLLPQLSACLHHHDFVRLNTHLNSLIGHFAVIVETSTLIIAFVDVIRSYPIFYATDEHHNLAISNSAHLLKQKYQISQVDQTALLEFMMAGYVTNRETIYHNLYQLRAGEYLLWDKMKCQLTVQRYFRYHPSSHTQHTASEYVEELANATDRTFERLLNAVGDAPIWLPLSGGLDSRLILAKLHSLGCSNLHTFSYGPRGNYEAKAAQAVAKTLNVPWQFIQPNASKARQIFDSSQRRAYWEYADSLSAVPVMNDYQALHSLRESGQLSENAVVINGQSGDFTSGGHIPLKMLIGPCSAQQLTDFVIYKHYSLWHHLKTPENVEFAKSRILSVLGLEEHQEMTMPEIAAFYEEWEWQERQSKLVVNGQRIYEFLGLGWQLPLWDTELVRFWSQVPLNLRLEQSLYIQYLEHFNYHNLFQNYRSESRRWPGAMAGTIILNQLERALLGDQQRVYKYASYWGHYSDQYALYGLRYFLKNIKTAVIPPQGRGLVALGTKLWCEENDIQIPS